MHFLSCSRIETAWLQSWIKFLFRNNAQRQNFETVIRPLLKHLGELEIRPWTQGLDNVAAKPQDHPLAIHIRRQLRVHSGYAFDTPLVHFLFVLVAYKALVDGNSQDVDCVLPTRAADGPVLGAGRRDLVWPKDHPTAAAIAPSVCIRQAANTAQGLRLVSPSFESCIQVLVGVHVDDPEAHVETGEATEHCVVPRISLHLILLMPDKFSVPIPEGLPGKNHLYAMIQSVSCSKWNRAVCQGQLHSSAESSPRR